MVWSTEEDQHGGHHAWQLWNGISCPIVSHDLSERGCIVCDCPQHVEHEEAEYVTHLRPEFCGAQRILFKKYQW